MILDREFQLELMTKMAEAYPAAYNFSQDDRYRDSDFRTKLFTNLYYLQSHGLLDAKSIHLTLGASGGQSWTL